MASASDRGDRFALACGEMGVPAVITAATAAEAAGYEAVWIGESRLEPDPFVVAAAVLGATRRVAAGPGIAHVLDRHPVALARAALTLDAVAPGRALLGIGRGDVREAQGELGLGVAGGGAALEDAARICRPLLRGERVDHDGRHWSAHSGPAPARAAPGGRIPLAIAAVGPRTLRLAGALADVVLLNYGAPPEYVSWASERVAEGALAAGRDPGEVEVHGLVLVGRTDLRDEPGGTDGVRRTLGRLSATPPEQVATLTAPLGSPPARWDDAAMRRVAAIGDRDACTARIAAYRAAGLRCVIVMPSGMRALIAD